MKQNYYTCPGRCSECKYSDGITPICWALANGESVKFHAHGAGLNPAAGQRAKKRYLENLKKAFAELSLIIAFIIATVKHVRNSSNRKTGDIPTINLPAFITCANCVKCDGGCWETGACYAIHGLTATYTSVKARVRNYLLYKNAPAVYFNLAAKDTHNYRYARWHDSGDIIDLEYFRGMVQVALTNPGTVYLAMTKQLDIVNSWCDKYGRGSIPDNLHILISTWKNFDAAENCYNFPTTGVIFDGENA